jgi:hypothetical protein
MHHIPLEPSIAPGKDLAEVLRDTNSGGGSRLRIKETFAVGAIDRAIA